MKKNNMMRVASALLVAVLLTSSVISGTFAKYVTSGNAGGSARVAKWGVTFTAQSDLFKKTYNTDDKNYNSMVLSVESSDDKNVVAPGTTGTGYSFTTNGTPEVSYKVNFEQTKGTTPETVFLKNGAEEYYPVVFTMEFNGKKVTSDTQDIATILNTVKNFTYYFDVNDKGDGKYYVSDDGGTTWTEQATAPALEISWAWDFDDAEGKGTNDTKDTALGNLAAGMDVEGSTEADYNLNVAFDITATATQID